MEFTKYTCPVCNEQFKSGDDIVVCPECGAPHHRECYEKTEHCFFEDKHSDNFSFEELNSESETEDSDNSAEDNNETVVCPVCFHKNAKGEKVCSRCGSELENSKAESTEQRNSGQSFNQNSMPPFGFGASGVPPFDPLAGIDSKEEIGDGINAGETAKFVGKNTQYFSIVFFRLKNLNKSKFSFSAFLFSGIYFLYRKMYGIGLIFSLIMIATDVLSTYILLSPEWASYVNEITTNGATVFTSDLQSSLFFLLTSLLIYFPFILRLLSGIFANRWYYKHSMKKIKVIKDGYSEDFADSLNKKLEIGGGVNLPIAISFGAATLIISYICRFFLM